MNNPTPDQPSQIIVSVGRQPIFDIKKHLWGYALFCVNNIENEKTGHPFRSPKPCIPRGIQHLYRCSAVHAAGKKSVGRFWGKTHI